MSVWLSTTTCPTPASTASAISCADFALPCRWIRAGSKPALSAMASSPPEATSQARPSSLQDAQHRRARERLGGEVDLEVLAARGVGGDEGPRALAHVVLDDDVGRRAELARQLDRVASAQLEVPGLGDPAAEWIDVAELGRHGARKATFARSLRKRSGRARTTSLTRSTPHDAAARPPRRDRRAPRALGGDPARRRLARQRRRRPAAGGRPAHRRGLRGRRRPRGRARAGLGPPAPGRAGGAAPASGSSTTSSRASARRPSRPPTAGASARPSSPPTPSTRSSSSSAWSSGARPAGCAERCATRPSSCSTSARATRRPPACATRSPIPTAPRTPRSRWRCCCAPPAC